MAGRHPRVLLCRRGGTLAVTADSPPYPEAAKVAARNACGETRAGANRQTAFALLLASSEARHAVRWSVDDGDQPGVPRFDERGARSAERRRAIR